MLRWRPFFYEIINLRIGPLRLHWFIDAHIHFLYIYWRKRYWRFSPAGYLWGDLP